MCVTANFQTQTTCSRLLIKHILLSTPRGGGENRGIIWVNAEGDIQLGGPNKGIKEEGGNDGNDKLFGGFLLIVWKHAESDFPPIITAKKISTYLAIWKKIGNSY